eukprot:2588446-Amphidinium_carterae.1
MVGRKSDLDWLVTSLQSTMKFNPASSVFGETPQRYLGKLYCRTSEGITITHDPAYEQSIIDAMNLTSAKPVSTPGTDLLKPETASEKLDWDEVLSRELATYYRAVLGKLRFLAPERPDLCYEL